MLYLCRPRVKLKDLTGGFRTDWQGSVIEKISGILKKPNSF
jgi:hypothetical protein